MTLIDKPIAILPARLNSKRLPKKNILNFKNKPLISWAIRKAIKSNLFRKIIVSSESLHLKKICKKEGVEFFERKNKLSQNKSTVIEVCKDVLNSNYFDHAHNNLICCIYPTALLLEVGDLKKSYNEFKKSEFQSLISVSEYNLPPFQALYQNKKYWSLFFKKYEKKQSNFYPEILCDAGMIYWISKKNLFKYNSFYTNKMGVHKIPVDRVCDLNTPMDLARLRLNLKFIKNEKKIFV